MPSEDEIERDTEETGQLIDITREKDVSQESAMESRQLVSGGTGVKPGS